MTFFRRINQQCARKGKGNIMNKRIALASAILACGLSAAAFADSPFNSSMIAQFGPHPAHMPAPAQHPAPAHPHQVQTNTSHPHQVQTNTSHPHQVQTNIPQTHQVQQNIPQTREAQQDAARAKMNAAKAQGRPAPWRYEPGPGLYPWGGWRHVTWLYAGMNVPPNARLYLVDYSDDGSEPTYVVQGNTVIFTNIASSKCIAFGATAPGYVGASDFYAPRIVYLIAVFPGIGFDFITQDK